MAVGVEAMFMGSVLKHEPHSGVVEIDALLATATVNSHPVEMPLAGYLNRWTVAELGRKNLDVAWLRTATVTINYSWSRGNGDRSDWVDYTARVAVVSEWGENSGTFANTQSLVG
jgi:hypothetical protein